jgi:hypothetical protein
MSAGYGVGSGREYSPVPQNKPGGPVRQWWRALPAPFKVGVITCLLAFVVSFRQTYTEFENGVLTDYEYRDYGALICAGITLVAVLVGVLGWVMTRKDRLPGRMIAIISLVLLVVAGLHAARGAGVVMVPDPPSQSASVVLRT